MTEKDEEMLDDLDRKASVGLAFGGDGAIKIDAMDLRRMVKAVRTIDAARANYVAARRRVEDRELRFDEAIWRTLAVVALCSAILQAAGLT